MPAGGAGEETGIGSPKRSSRDPEVLRERLVEWLRTVMPEGADPHVPELRSPASTGMSSETLLFEVAWTDGGERRARDFVARVAPDLADVPVFPSYDLEAQYRVIELVRSHTAVPVPTPVWLELDPAALGAPFFVMERVEGRVPPDVMPYNMQGWLLEAGGAEQRMLQDASVALLAELHRLRPTGVDTSFLDPGGPGHPGRGDTALSRHVANWRAYDSWVRAGRDIPVLARAWQWLDENWPDDEGEPVLSWGDARIGNVLYDGFRPVAVLDWEMAAVAPRGVDLGWMVFLHEFFEHVAKAFSLPGMPDFMRPQDAAAEYRERSGHEVRDLLWYRVYAAVRHGVIMARIHDRQVAFGEAEESDDPEAGVMHRALIEEMIAG